MTVYSDSSKANPTNTYSLFKNIPFTPSASQHNLYRLSIIRSIVLSLLVASAFYGYWSLNINLQLPTIGLLLALYATLTGLAFYRAKHFTRIGDNEFTLHLITEVAFTGLLVFQTGGATNPFVSYFLVPISIAAATVPWSKASIIAAFSAATYTLLLFYYQPLEFFSHHAASMDHAQHSTQGTAGSAALYNAHYLGMWFNFVLSALLISWFVAKMAQAIRTQDNEINQQRETQLRDEQILSIASMAAGTAHELGTPINSLKLLVDDFEQPNNPLGETNQNDLLLMKSQLLACEKSLQKLVATAQQSQPAKKQKVKVGEWLLSCISQWQPLRPEATVSIGFDASQQQATILSDETLRQAMVNLLNNAANASPDFIEVNLTIESKHQQVAIIIRDHGKGIPDNILALQGTQLVKNQQPGKQEGLGFGIFLSNTSINRLGGKLRLSNQLSDDGMSINGAEIRITLPIIQHTYA